MNKLYSESTELLDEMIIEDADTLKVLAHPQRLEILRNLEVSRTVKEVAERIEADPTKLYYHVRLMEKAGIIRVTETNVVSGIIEKHYQIVARGYRIAENLVKEGSLTDDDIDQIAISVFDNTRHQFQRSQRAGLLKLDEQSPHPSTALSSTFMHLTEGQLVEFNERLQALMDDLSSWSDENRGNEADLPAYILTLAFFRLAEENR